MQIHHIAIITSDYARGKTFYRDILGMDILAEHYRPARDSWKCDLGWNGRYVIELFSFPDSPPRAGCNGYSAEACGLRHLAFTVENAEQMRQELQAKGVECEAVRVDEFTGKSFFFIKDPDGLPLEFYQR